MTMLATLKGGVISTGDNAVCDYLVSKVILVISLRLSFYRPLWFLSCCQHPTLSWSQSSLISCDYLGTVSKYVDVGLPPEYFLFPAYSRGVSRSSFKEPINVYIQASQIQMWSSHTWLVPPASLLLCSVTSQILSHSMQQMQVTLTNC